MGLGIFGEVLMCGISGIFQINPTGNNLEMIFDMSDIIHHRGPDDEGFIFIDCDRKKFVSYAGKDTPEDVLSSNKNLIICENHQYKTPSGVIGALGHRRLSIIDLSASGHQPMIGGNVCITFNGEIYNYLELKNELSALGYKFETNSDTEVIIAAYSVWGFDCLDKLNGMFSFVLVDLTKGIVFVARDRFGIKPLYYWKTDDFIAFASEIKQFTIFPEWRPAINHERAFDYLVYGLMDHTRETFFSNIYQLLGGEALTFSLSKIEDIKITKWYKPEPDPFIGSYAEAIEKFNALLNKAIEKHLQADVKVGSCLSGGLDSSSIVSIVNNIMKKSKDSTSQLTISSCSEDPRFDEREFIELVLKRYDIESEYVFPTALGLVENINKIIWQNDEPFGSCSVYAQHQVFSAAASRQVKVMLDGQGADEHLGGYHSFFFINIYEEMREKHFSNCINEIMALHSIHKYGFIKIISSSLTNALPDSIYGKLLNKFGINNGHSKYINYKGNKSVDKNMTLRSSKHNSVEDLSRYFIDSGCLPALLHWEDRSSMTYSVEARVPFLDHTVVEFNINLPNEYIISGGTTKRILRDAVKGILPEQIETRQDKMGFETPEMVWLTKSNAKDFGILLLQAVKSSNGIISEDMLRLYNEMVSGRLPYNRIIWRSICLGVWINVFQVDVS